jgi:hypothetical protein
MWRFRLRTKTCTFSILWDRGGGNQAERQAARYYFCEEKFIYERSDQGRSERLDEAANKISEALDIVAELADELAGGRPLPRISGTRSQYPRGGLGFGVSHARH